MSFAISVANWRLGSGAVTPANRRSCHCFGHAPRSHSKFFAKAAASLSAPSGRDKASIYLHTLKVECPVASEGSFLREAIQQVLVKMTTADETVRFVTVTDKAIDPNDIPKNNSEFAQGLEPGRIILARVGGLRGHHAIRHMAPTVLLPLNPGS